MFELKDLRTYETLFLFLQRQKLVSATFAPTVVKNEGVFKMKNIIKAVALTAAVVTITVTACNENRGTDSQSSQIAELNARLETIQAELEKSKGNISSGKIAIASSTSNNRLANTKWQSKVGDVTLFITFGQISFSYWLFRSVSASIPLHVVHKFR